MVEKTIPEYSPISFASFGVLIQELNSLAAVDQALDEASREDIRFRLERIREEALNYVSDRGKNPRKFCVQCGRVFAQPKDEKEITETASVAWLLNQLLSRSTRLNRKQMKEGVFLLEYYRLNDVDGLYIKKCINTLERDVKQSFMMRGVDCLPRSLR